MEKAKMEKKMGNGEKDVKLLYLNSSVSIGQLMQAVRQFRSFCLDKWVIECSALELFEAMDCIFEV